MEAPAADVGRSKRPRRARHHVRSNNGARVEDVQGRLANLIEGHLTTLLEGLIAGKEPLNAQEASILFRIPGEIRNHIFSYVVTEHDRKAEIAPTEYWYRPNFTHHRYVDTALLRTCRRVWVETFAMPVEQVTRRYWAGDYQRRPRQLSYPVRQAAQALRHRKDMKNRRIVPLETMQVFIQMFALERHWDLKGIITSAERDIPTRHLIITIRYTDWWFWEDNQPLRIDSRWNDRLELPDTLEKLTMELETRQGKKDELDAIVRRQVAAWEFKTSDGKRLAAAPPKAMSFIGTDRPGGTSYNHHKALYNPAPKGMEPTQEGEMYYYLVSVDFLCTTSSG